MIVSDISADRGIAFEFVYMQGTPSDTWVIDHDMQCHPSVTVIDSGNNQVEGSVTYNSINKITITFTAGFSGKAILR